MKHFQSLVFALALVSAMYGESVDFRAPEIIPVPREMTYVANVAVRLDTNAVFEVAAPIPPAAR